MGLENVCEEALEALHVCSVPVRISHLEVSSVVGALCGVHDVVGLGAGVCGHPSDHWMARLDAPHYGGCTTSSVVNDGPRATIIVVVVVLRAGTHCC